MSNEGTLIGTSQWCPDCRTRAVVVDDHLEANQESGYMSRYTTEVEVRVLDLNCGHSTSWQTGHDVTTRDAP